MLGTLRTERRDQPAVSRSLWTNNTGIYPFFLCAGPVGAAALAGFSKIMVEMMRPMIDPDTNRNLRCTRYNRCLSDACRRNLPGFDCRGCRHRNDEDTIDPREVENCILLLWAITAPDLYDRIREKEFQNQRRQRRRHHKISASL
jgi:hypothetical protein